MDLISRKAAIDACYDGWNIGSKEISANIRALPSAQPEQKTGRWILWNYPGAECARCSVCKEEYDQMDLYLGGNEYPKFCPNCGAKMKEEQND